MPFLLLQLGQERKGTCMLMFIRTVRAADQLALQANRRCVLLLLSYMWPNEKCERTKSTRYWAECTECTKTEREREMKRKKTQTARKLCNNLYRKRKVSPKTLVSISLLVLFRLILFCCTTSSLFFFLLSSFFGFLGALVEKTKRSEKEANAMQCDLPNDIIVLELAGCYLLYFFAPFSCTSWINTCSLFFLLLFLLAFLSILFFFFVSLYSW